MIAERVLPLSGIHNFRDYGGYGVEGGGRLRSGVLWRSAHHQEATPDDLKNLSQLILGELADGAVVLGAVSDGKASVLAAASKAAIAAPPMKQFATRDIFAFSKIHPGALSMHHKIIH